MNHSNDDSEHRAYTETAAVNQQQQQLQRAHTRYHAIRVVIPSQTTEEEEEVLL